MRREINFPVAVTFDSNGDGFHPHLTDKKWPGWFAFGQKELDQLVNHIKTEYELTDEHICIFELRT
jgi:hypothetical protein